MSARANINAYDNKWVHVDVVHTENDVTLYLDGKEVGKEKSKFALTDILKDKSVLQLGKANWGAGEYGKGLIDNFRIYGEALNQDQITKQYAEYILPFDIEALDLPSETDRSRRFHPKEQAARQRLHGLPAIKMLWQMTEPSPEATKIRPLQ